MMFVKNVSSYIIAMVERLQNGFKTIRQTICICVWVCVQIFYVSNNKKHSLEVIMKLVNATVLGNLVSAHYEHDEKKFAAYVQFIIDAYEERGEKRQAEIIRKRMDGSYKSQPKVSLDNIKIPDEFSKM